MRRLLELLVLALGLAAGTNAAATATALVIVDGVPVVDLSSTGFAWMVDDQSVPLGPGQSADLHYTWSVSVKDDGLPNVFDPASLPPEHSPTGCLPLFPLVCGPQPTGFEQARASLQFGSMDPRGTDIPPGTFSVTTTGDTFISLTTNADLLADSLTRTGEVFLRIENVSDALVFATLPFATWAAGWVYSTPAVPEPSTVALMAAGLAVLGWRASWLRRFRPR